MVFWSCQSIFRVDLESGPYDLQNSHRASTKIIDEIVFSLPPSLGLAENPWAEKFSSEMDLVPLTPSSVNPAGVP